jgi:hypothetical protein
MKKIFYFGLVGLAAGQSACTFTDYPAIQGKVKEYFSMKIILNLFYLIILIF